MTVPAILVMARVESVAAYQWFKGRYKLASDIFIYAQCIFLFVFPIALGYIGEHTFGLGSLYGCSIAVMVVLLSVSSNQWKYQMAIGLAGLPVHIIWSIIIHSYTEKTSHLNQQIVVPLLILFIVTFMCVLLRRIFIKVLSDAVERLELSQK